MHRAKPLLSLLSSTLLACSSASDAPGAAPAGREASALSDRGRPALNLPGDTFYPEGIAAGPDGALYVGSLGTGAIVRSRPRALGTDPLVPGRSAFGVYGLAVDAAHDTLWACTYDDLLAPAQPAYLRAYALDTGVERAAYVLPGESGFCNDVTVHASGDVYVTDAFANTVLRLRRGAGALETWSSDPAYAHAPWAVTLNGLAFGADGSLLVGKFATGELFRIPVRADGSAGAPVTIPVTPALEGPDGVELLDADSLLVAEYSAGQLSRVDLQPDGTATKTVLARGFVTPTSVAVTGTDAWVLEGQLDFLFGAPGSPTLPFRAHRVPLQ